tara:strand:- start:180 stop:743 length:564 start_codon:yes stop_codon:yes gene_type:complete
MSTSSKRALEYAQEEEALVQKALTKKSQKLKTVNIKGKPYVEVNERLIYFRKHYQNYALETEVIEKTETTILIKAIISDENSRVIATGLAEEIKGSTFINKTSYVENCETSAWGRALANFGIGLDTSVASADEVKNAISQQSNVKPTLNEGAFFKAIDAIKKGSYKKEQLVAKYSLSNKQKQTLELC